MEGGDEGNEKKIKLKRRFLFSWLQRKWRKTRKIEHSLNPILMAHSLRDQKEKSTLGHFPEASYKLLELIFLLWKSVLHLNRQDILSQSL